MQIVPNIIGELCAFFPLFLLCQKGRSILSGRLEYTLYSCEGEFNHYNCYLYVLCFTTSLKICIVIIKKGGIWIYVFACIKLIILLRTFLNVMMMTTPVIVEIGGNSFPKSLMMVTKLEDISNLIKLKIQNSF